MMRSPNSASSTRRSRSLCGGMTKASTAALALPVHQRRAAGKLGKLAEERARTVRHDGSDFAPSSSRWVTTTLPARMTNIPGPISPVCRRGIRPRHRTRAHRTGAADRSPPAPARGKSGRAGFRSSDVQMPPWSTSIRPSLWVLHRTVIVCSDSRPRSTAAHLSTSPPRHDMMPGLETQFEETLGTAGPPKRSKPLTPSCILKNHDLRVRVLRRGERHLRGSRGWRAAGLHRGLCSMLPANLITVTLDADGDAQLEVTQEYQA